MAQGDPVDALEVEQVRSAPKMPSAPGQMAFSA